MVQQKNIATYESQCHTAMELCGGETMQRRNLAAEQSPSSGIEQQRISAAAEPCISIVQ